MRSLAKFLMLLCLLAVGHGAWAQSSGTDTYVYTDPQGTPLAEADANGNITATFDYTPYGSTALGTPPNGPGYTGHVNDPETNLVYMQARYYDPVTGHFVSADPIGIEAGDAFSFNRYVYVNNNPIMHIDATGEACGGNGEVSGKVQAMRDTSDHCDGAKSEHASSSQGDSEAASSNFSPSSWQWVIIGFSQQLCSMGIQASCAENSYVSDPAPSNGKEAGLAAAGGLIAGVATATISEGETTELTAGHMGIIGEIQELRGSISMQGGTMTVRVDMIRGNIKNPLSVINNLKTLAANSGAQTLRIEGTIANPGLYKVLSSRYGMTSQGAIDSITIRVH